MNKYLNVETIPPCEGREREITERISVRIPGYPKLSGQLTLSEELQNNRFLMARAYARLLRSLADSLEVGP